MATNMIFFAFILCLSSKALSHSNMADPQGTSPGTCRRGGDPDGNCAGPCDVSAFDKDFPWTRHFPPYNGRDGTTVAATYKRGQNVQVKYTRNNHGPGGFVRLTLVSVEDMMDKKVHSRNAFHYGCWGANPVEAKSNELGSDKYGFSLVGNDGEQHPYKQAYYLLDATIPTVVPDGTYILGWVWYGGCSTEVKGNVPQEPNDYPFFSDYWTCSYVEIKGGPMTNTYTPVFKSSQYSTEGCMAFADAPGLCTHEPCTTSNGKAETCFYRKPAFLKNDDVNTLVPEFFGGTSNSNSGGENEESKPETTPTSTPAATSTSKPTATPSVTKEEVKEEYLNDQVTTFSKGAYSCLCMANGSMCSSSAASQSFGCESGKDPRSQSSGCKRTCCDFCNAYSNLSKLRWLCSASNINVEC